jgi:hypothetical protein
MIEISSALRREPDEIFAVSRIYIAMARNDRFFRQSGKYPDEAKISWRIGFMRIVSDSNELESMHLITRVGHSVAWKSGRKCLISQCSMIISDSNYSWVALGWLG